MTIDTQNLKEHKWFEFLRKVLLVYHPKGSEQDNSWGARLHILKEYPQGCNLFEEPKKLNEDVQKTLLNFHKFRESFVI